MIIWIIGQPRIELVENLTRSDNRPGSRRTRRSDRGGGGYLDRSSSDLSLLNRLGTMKIAP
jgi:hypothetical protein